MLFKITSCSNDNNNNNDDDDDDDDDDDNNNNEDNHINVNVFFPSRVTKEH